MTIGIGINGFGRMGRLALRVARSFPGLRVTHINEVGGDSAAAAHLFKYDSQHGTWHENVEASGNEIRIDGTSISYSRNERISSTDWTKAGADIVVECTGKFKSADLLSEYLSNGVKKVIVAAPVKDGTLNIVMGVNDHLYDSSKHHIVTAASCTTNCLAPMAKAIDDGKYFKIPSDNRDLNYNKFFNDGSYNLSTISEYNSENTEKLNFNELKNLLLKLDLIKILVFDLI